MSGLRMRSQQAHGRGNFMQYVSGKALAALAYEITPDFLEVFLRFGGEYVARHLARVFRRI